MNPNKAILDLYENEILKDTEISEDDVYDMDEDDNIEFDDIE